MASHATLLTCPTCERTVSKEVGSRRTICPHCGSFYIGVSGQPQGANDTPWDAEAQRLPRRRSENDFKEKLPRRRLPSLDRSQHKREKSKGPLKSVANFFQNLRNKSGGESSKRAPPKGLHPSASAPDCSTPTLPAIASESRGRLTVDNPSPVRDNSSRSSRHSQHTTNSLSSPRSNPQNGRDPAALAKIIKSLKIQNAEQLRDELEIAQKSKNWNDLQDFYSNVFDSFGSLNAAFKRETSHEYKSAEDAGLQLEYAYGVYDCLTKANQEVQKVVLKAVINGLLRDKRPHTKDDLRAYMILLLCPQFSSISTFVIFAHLLRQVAALSDQDHHFLVSWFKQLEVGQFKTLLQRLHNFISCRLFPPRPQDLPPISKCTWWIPSATKVLALLNATNNMCYPVLVSHMEFYNSSLDLLDLTMEYYTWQSPTSSGFSFCQYPFILSLMAKRSILQRDSEQQMITMARRSLVAKVQRRQYLDMGMLFLNLTVRRSHLVTDSLNEIARKQHDLKKKLKVTFAGEPGLDMGGLTKEWFLLLIRQIFQEEYGMFTLDKQSRQFWFSTAAVENCQEFNLVGVLMGLAVYNSIILDLHFPPICYRKLLSPPVVPYNDPSAVVGISPVTLKELKEAKPDVAKGLQELLDYEGDVESDFCLTFQISVTEFGVMRTHDLKPQGDDLPVTNTNKAEYVHLYCDFLLNKSIYPQFQAFYHGFHTVCASNALIMLRPEEVEHLVCGNPNLNLQELETVTTYDGYTSADPTIKMFWDVVKIMPLEMQKRFLLFTTGSDRIPIGGMAEMTFKITRVDNTDMLPMAHTCFNQLVLPAYKHKKNLKKKLVIAVNNAEGFGIE